MDTDRKLKNSPFTDRQEALNILVPLCFLAAGIFEIFTRPAIGKTNDYLLTLLTEYLFLNTLHALFTFLFFINIDEFKNFANLKSSQLGRPLFSKWILIYIVFLITSAFLFFNSKNGSAFFPFSNVVIQLAVIYRLHHAVSQSTGISLLYYSSLGIDDTNRSSVGKSISLERLFVPIILTVSFISLLGVLFIKPELKGPVFLLNVAAVVLLIFGLTYYNSKHDKSFSKIRALFALRYLLYPLAFTSRLATAGIFATHGIEYMLINNKIHNFRPMSMFQKAKSLFYVFAFIYVISSLICFVYFATTPQVQDAYMWLFLAGFVVFQSTTFIHFYIDRSIFKFKDPCVQQTIGHLFFPNLSERTSPQHASNNKS